MSSFKNFVLTGGAHAARIGGAFFLVKCLAYFLGPEGFGRIGHFLSFMTIVSVVSAGGGNALIRYAAIFKNDENEFLKIKNAGQIYIILLSCIVSICLMLFKNDLSMYIFKSSEYGWVFGFVSIVHFLLAWCSFFSGILCGKGDTLNFSKSQLIGYLLILPLIYYLCEQRSFYSSILAVGVLNIGTFLPLLVYYLKSENGQKIAKGFVLKDIKPFLKFLLMAMMSAFTFPIVEMLIREMLVRKMSFREVGLWQGGMKISSAYMGFFGTFLFYYFMPKLSKDLSLSELSMEIKEIFKIVVPIFLIGVTILLVFREFFVGLILSKDFLELSKYLHYQVLGDFFKLLCYSLGVVVVAKEITWLYIVGEVFQNALLLAVTNVILFFNFTVENVFISYVISYLLYFLIVIFIYKKYIKNLAKNTIEISQNHKISQEGVV